MNNNTLYHFGYGAIIGNIQTLIGHPLDTLKALKQTNINITKTHLQIRNLYKGIQYPLAMSITFNSGIFGIYSYLQKLEYSREVSGLISGGIMGFISNPLEYYKINTQIGNKPSLMDHKFNIQIWRGCGYTTARESIATGFYFSNYHYLNEQLKLSPFIAGGISGCLSWAITYPLDTLKTIKQSNDISLLNILKTKGGLQHINIWNGFLICQARAFIVNGISFIMYDYLQKNNR